MSFLQEHKFPIIMGFLMLVILPAFILLPNLTSMWRGPDKVLEEYWQDAVNEDYGHQFSLLSRLFQLRMLSKSTYITHRTRERERFDREDPSGKAELVLEEIVKINQENSTALFRTSARYGARLEELTFRLKIEKGKWEIFDIRKESDMPAQGTETRRESTSRQSSAINKMSGQTQGSTGSTDAATITGPGSSSQDFTLQVVDKIPESQKQKARPSSGKGEFKGGVKNAKSVLKGLLDAGHDAGLLDDSEYQSKTQKLSSLKKR